MQVFEFKKASSLNSAIRSSNDFACLPDIIKQHCLFSCINTEKKPNLSIEECQREPRLLVVFRDQLASRDGKLFSMAAYIVSSGLLELVSIQCMLLPVQNSNSDQIALVGTLQNSKHQNTEQLSALVHSWIHAQNNLMSTISGYAELLAMDSDDQMLDEILSRCKQVASFNEDNAAFTVKQNTQINADVAKKDQVLANVSRSLERYFQFEDITQWHHESFRLDAVERLVCRWTVSGDFSIEKWDISSIYQAIGHRCHYLLKFELMRMQYYLGQIGAVIRTIKSQNNAQTVIEIVVPIQSNNKQTSSIQGIIVPVKEQQNFDCGSDSPKDSNTYKLAELLTSLGIMCWAVPINVFKANQALYANNHFQVLQDSSIQHYFEIFRDLVSNSDSKN
jgi:hypothetical protein